MSAHGTRSSYTSGCRCDDCRIANRGYHEKRRRSAGMKPQRRGNTHGVSSTYNLGCRCGLCTEANRVTVANYRARRRCRTGSDR